MAATDERDEGGEQRVSTLELFFDLVFVFTITQLTSTLAHHPDGEHLLQIGLMLGVIWWMYAGFLWLTNSVAPDRTIRRFLLLGGMACWMVISLTIPTAFSEDGAIFAAAYFVVIVIHAFLFTQATAETAARAILVTVRFNLTAAALILVGALIGEHPWDYVMWGLAVLTVWSSALLQDSSNFRLSAGHIAERHGLVVIVALGESVVAVGLGAAAQDLTAGLLAVAVLGLVLSSALYWTYFGDDEEAPRRALEAIPDEERAEMVLNAYYFTHLPILLGIVAVAAGLEEGIAHPYDPAPTGIALCLGGGAALFFCADFIFRRQLHIRQTWWPAAAGVLALATVPLGTEGSALLQLGVLAAAVVACLMAEHLLRRKPVSLSSLEPPAA